MGYFNIFKSPLGRIFKHYPALGLYLLLIQSAISAPPVVVVSPSRELIEFNQNTGQFIFDQFMSTSSVHIEWVGINADQAVTSWVLNPLISGSFQLQVVFKGPIAEGTEVQWTLNPGQSGLMKSMTGEALAETKGSLVLPAISGSGPVDDCDDDLISNFQPEAGSAIAGRQFRYLQQMNGELSVDPDDGHDVAFTLLSDLGGTTPATAELVLPDNSSQELVRVAFPLAPVSFFLGSLNENGAEIPQFEDESILIASYPAGIYKLLIDKALPTARSIDLPISDATTIPQPKFSNLSIIENVDKSTDWIVSWQGLTGTLPTDRLELQLSVIESDGELREVYTAPKECADIALTISDTSHTVPAELLDPNDSFQIELTYIRVDSFIDDENTEFNSFSGTLRRTVSRFVRSSTPSTLEFTNVTILDGNLNITVSGNISDNLSSYQLQKVQSIKDTNWQTVAIITKPLLDLLPDRSYTYTETASEDQAFFRLIPL